jgi:hypothetical protein
MKGTLRVHLIEGEDLKAVDMGGNFFKKDLMYNYFRQRQN